MRFPVSTPAGIFTCKSWRARTRPSPAHSRQGFAITLPYPEHGPHGRDVITWPITERTTCCVSPRPLQTLHTVGWPPSIQPLPVHFGHTTALSTLMSRSVPKQASCRSTSMRISESCPARIRGRGPRDPPPPKNASMMSLKPPPKFAPPKLLPPMS